MWVSNFVDFELARSFIDLFKSVTVQWHNVKFIDVEKFSISGKSNRVHWNRVNVTREFSHVELRNSTNFQRRVPVTRLHLTEIECNGTAIFVECHNQVTWRIFLWTSRENFQLTRTRKWNSTKFEPSSHVHTHIRFLQRFSADVGKINFKQFSVYETISQSQLQTCINYVATLQLFTSTLKHV